MTSNSIEFVFLHKLQAVLYPTVSVNHRGGLIEDGQAHALLSVPSDITSSRFGNTVHTEISQKSNKQQEQQQRNRSIGLRMNCLLAIEHSHFQDWRHLMRVQNHFIENC